MTSMYNACVLTLLSKIGVPHRNARYYHSAKSVKTKLKESGYDRNIQDY